MQLRIPLNNEKEQMMKRFTLSVMILMTFLWCTSAAQEVLRMIPLPRPDTTGGKPLMQVLKERRTSRSFSEKSLSEQVLANLLWAAFGVNRPDGHRTAPSARNWQEIDVYVATADGLFLYDARAHALKQLLKDDIRAKTGTQSFVGSAPVNLVYVADLARTNVQASDEQNFYSGADCGFIAENVYVYCASEGLAVVVRASIDRAELSRLIRLRPEQKIILGQTVGYPKN
jgi:SagB-type dehydrogenase family enzyme